MAVTTARKISTEASANLVSSSIGMKLFMAVTGLAFIGFVIGHLAGNLQIFIGQDQVNSYAEFLKGLGKILWIVRILLFLFLLLHLFYGVKLFFANKSARPVAYVHNDYVQATYSSRTMIWTGLAVIAFVTYHLLHFTFIVTNPEYTEMRDAAGRFDVYSMVILGFKNIAIAGVYILAIFFLAVHLSHALPSLFQTLGLTNEGLRSREKIIGNLFAAIIFAGYVSIPTAILLGLIELPMGGM